MKNFSDFFFNDFCFILFYNQALWEDFLWIEEECQPNRAVPLSTYLSLYTATVIAKLPLTSMEAE